MAGILVKGGYWPEQYARMKASHCARTEQRYLIIAPRVGVEQTRRRLAKLREGPGLGHADAGEQIAEVAVPGRCESALMVLTGDDAPGSGRFRQRKPPSIPQIPT